MRMLLFAIWISVSVVGSLNAQCELSADYANDAVVIENDLKVTLATTNRVYRPGDVVRFCLIVQNLGPETVHINWGTDPQDGIFVLDSSCESIDQGDCLLNSPFIHPQVWYFFSTGTTLDPGECRIWEHTWTTTGLPTPGGNYVVLGGMYEPRSQRPWGEFHVPTTPVRLELTIDGRVPTENATWSRIKALYS